MQQPAYTNIVTAFITDNPYTISSCSQVDVADAAVTIFDVSRNRLNYIPATLFSLMPALRFLDASSNRIRTLPPDTVWCEGGWPEVCRVKLDNNLLVHLPQYLTQLHGLRVLELSSNALVELPSKPWRCAQLTTLVRAGGLVGYICLPRCSNVQVVNAW